MVMFHKREESRGSGLAGPSGPGSRSQLPMIQMPDKLRFNALCMMGEFVGTFLFLFFSFAGTQVSNTPAPEPGANPNTSNLLYSSLCFGFALTVNVWAFYRVTGGLFNPAVSQSQALTMNPSNCKLIELMMSRSHLLYA
jgi:aquaporin related protein